jgi:glycine oxidase
MNIVIIGCGVVGAAIAYELSQVSGLKILVIDRQQPAQASTGAALGVLMGAISQKAKGHNLAMRLQGIQQYDRWIPQIEAITGRTIPYNRQGILRLCFEGELLERWRSLQAIRQQQGWQLDILSIAQLAAEYPQLSLERVIGAVYSPSDRQVDPTALTGALVAAAQQNGAIFHFHTEVTDIAPENPVQVIHTSAGALPADWLVIAAGLGSTLLTASLQQPVDIRPVLGQALQVQLSQPLSHTALQPVITGEDMHCVPLGGDQYWVGATVEFPEETSPVLPPHSPIIPHHFPVQPNAAQLEAVRQKAIALCPAFATATILRQWSGLRPRPQGRPAPIIELLSGYSNVLLATGHYRNGVLLAPATAAKVREMICNQTSEVFQISGVLKTPEV